MDNLIIIKYQSSKKEITEREISSIMSKVADNSNKILFAYCHLRDETRSFILDNILEIKLNGKIINKNDFWLDNIKDKNNLIKELEKMLNEKKKEYEDYVNIVNNILDKIK